MGEEGNFPVDPGLLVSLEALLRHGNVTAAAGELGISQSAMSQRLRRLREGLEDPLLVASAEGLVMTERARRMAAPLRRALQDLRAAVQAGAPFEPARAQHRFRISTNDVGELLVLPSLMRWLDREAPGIRVDFCQHHPEALPAALERGDVDLAVGGPVAVRASGFRTTTIGQERFAVLVRADHPLLGGLAPGAVVPLGIYLACRHLLIAPSGRPGGVVDDLLAGMGRSREVVARISHFVTAPAIVAQSDLVLMCSQGLARYGAARLPLRVLEPPAELPLPWLPLAMLWHERSQEDAAHRWLRDLSREVTVRALELA